VDAIVSLTLEAQRAISDERRPSPSVSVVTFGCKLNQTESEAILAQFRAAGYCIANNAAEADVFVVNTCAVTAAAERKARSVLRRERCNPNAVVMAVGCMAERVPDELARIGGVHVVLGNTEKGRILDFVDPPTETAKSQIHVGGVHELERMDAPQPLVGLRGRTRAFLKIQDGCSQHCTYCIVPRLRGRGRSLPIDAVLNQVRQLVEQGFEEIVLTGVALGTYARDFGILDGLADLLQAIETVPGLQRLRLGSVEPWSVSNRFLEVIANSDVICPHLHLPLQCADDTILRRMGRRYSVHDIERIWNRAMALRSDWGFGSDVIVGFPGESSSSFAATCQFLADSPISYLHVFPFSPRPGTPAMRLQDFVPNSVIRERVRSMKELDSQLRVRFRERQIGTVHSVLFESRRKDALLAGHAANYLDVYTDASDALAGRICPVRITALHPDGVVGTLN